ncbi:DUF3108 domain-containing protein [Xylophilus rhododendri]|uniref:DUF3108 domain-containing protein n=1 Tax=Xylophilus rhododendri TaxID=2697032 RepID=A0A857J847_9BURK|nr:DUF3108 domain-containing protein [Xylophilus rhododendri]QHI99182.1 DUF3108 domain-containing protein [Xylophilus rhododendri]
MRLFSLPALTPTRRPIACLVLLAAAVLLAHLAVLGWLPMGSSRGQALDEKTLHLVTRVLPAPPPAPPKPPPRPRPVTPPAPAVPAPAAEPAASETSTDTATTTAADTGTDSMAAPASTEAASAPPETAAPAETPAEPAVASTAPPPPVGLPQSVRLKYDMQGEYKKLLYHAGAELLWQQDGARYSARMEVSAFLIGSRVQTSEGAIGAGGLEPERFADKARREQATHFDRDQHRIVFSANTPEMPLPPGVQDRLSVFLQLSSQLAGDPGRYPEGSTITIPTAGPRDLADWSFVVGAPETLQLRLGSQPTIKLERAPRKEYDTRVEVWFAPALGYLPVRMRITQQTGDYIEQTLESAERP